MPQVGFRQAPVKLPESYGGLVRMLVARAPDRVEYAYCSQKRHGLAGCRQQLLNGLLMIARFAENLTIQNCQLVCTDDERPAGIDRDRFCFLAREVGRQLLGSQPLIVRFIDVRRHCLVVIEKTVEQATPIGGGRGQEDRR